MGRFPLPPAPTRPAPTCGLTVHGRVGRLPPGEVPGRRAAYGRYRTAGNGPPSPFSLVQATCVVLATSLCCTEQDADTPSAPATTRIDRNEWSPGPAARPRFAG